MNHKDTKKRRQQADLHRVLYPLDFHILPCA